MLDSIYSAIDAPLRSCAIRDSFSRYFGITDWQFSKRCHLSHADNDGTRMDTNFLKSIWASN